MACTACSALIGRLRPSGQQREQRQRQRPSTTPSVRNVSAPVVERQARMHARAALRHGCGTLGAHANAVRMWKTNSNATRRRATRYAEIRYGA
jgi:hypothetical protein